MFQVPILESDKIRTESSRLFDARNYYLKGVNRAYSRTRNLAAVLANVQGLLGDLGNTHGYTKATNPEYQRTLGSAIIMLAPLAPHFCTELWATLQTLPNKTWKEFKWNKSVFHQVLITHFDMWYLYFHSVVNRCCKNRIASQDIYTQSQ